MPWTRCTGWDACGGRYNTDKCMDCETDGETPEELEAFRTSPFWADHEAKAKVASAKGRFTPMVHTCQ